MTIPENSNPVTLPPMPYAKKDSALAIVSLVSGLLSWTFLPFIAAIVAIVTGHLAKKEIRDSGGMTGGDGMALAGLILGYVQVGLILLAIIVIVAIIYAFSPAWGSGFNSFTTMLPSCMM
jgi:hypothetical protein